MPALSAHRAAPRAPTWAGLLLALAACAPANTLEGSLGEVLDLGFEGVEVSRTEDAVIVGYHRPRGEGRDVVLKLVARLGPEAVFPGDLDLGPDAAGLARATVSRSVARDPVRELAPILRGVLHLEAKPELERPVSGEFRVTLGEGGVGEGRTAFGRFEAARVVPGN